MTFGPGGARRTGTTPSRPDAGFTLIEVLVAVTIMALVFTIVLSGIFSAIVITDTNRRRADAERLARDFAEQLKDGDTEVDTLHTYEPCAEPDDYDPYVPPSPFEDWRVEIAEVEYRDPSDPTAWISTCTIAAGKDEGVQRITITARPPATERQVTQTVVVVKRDTREDQS